MNKCRASFDAMLHTHEIDVCRLFSVLCYCFTAAGIYFTVGQLIFRIALTFDLTLILYFFMGYAFGKHKSWPRTMMLVLSWLAISVMFLFFAWLAIRFFQQHDAAAYTLTIGSAKIQEPPDWMMTVIVAWVACCVILCVLAFFLLYSRKIREEIRVGMKREAKMIREPPEPLDPEPPVSKLNRRLQGIVIGLSVAVTIGFSVLGFAVGSKQHDVRQAKPLSDIREVKWDGTNHYFAVNQSLIITTSRNYQCVTSKTSKRPGMLECSVEFAGYPMFRVKPHQKYTLENGDIRVEP